MDHSRFTMKSIFVVLALVAAALAAPKYEPIFQDYHQEFGVEQAARIKAIEEATDFDGSRIAGGSHVQLGQFPFMGGLVINLTTGQRSVCGSSMLSNTRAVTAAHCWRSRNSQAWQFTVVYGSLRLFSGGVRVNTNNVQMHASFNQNTLANDIAVIVHGWVGFSHIINRINLASGNNLFVNNAAHAVGFGRTADNVGIGQNQVLSYVRLTVISNAECQRTYISDFIIASTLCTSGAGGRSTCPGDSGGPLAIGTTLIGVASFGPSVGCTRGYPAGFARVTAFNAWIRARM